MRRLTVLGVVAWAAIAFLALPLIVVIASSFTANGDLSFPIGGFSLEAYTRLLSDEQWLNSIRNSCVIAAAGAVVSTTIGFSMAIVNVRNSYRGRTLVEGVILAPLVLPHAALAIALFSLERSIGIIGSFFGILAAHIVITLPFAYRPLITAFKRFDQTYAEAGSILGAPPGRVFRTVIMPILKPAIVISLLFTFIISFDEATVTLFLKGPNTTTLPVMIFGEMQEGTGLVVPAVSTLLITVTIGLVMAIEKMVGLDVFVTSEAG
ncbi:ABC transporter permease [Caballeronia sp. dw_19]|uniref:ABC transporter permease n=1 Tax=Caballeronia sp. dw_19 TaxID=2719791 RepID=UPI001BD0B194|nr:ABC transporter permease [Caballeronia sp. dw_19]